jgi:putative phosphoesterase
MRTLVISDIHGNLAALDAVLMVPHDLLVCLGDIVGYGPQPSGCVRRVRDNLAVAVQGNHDRAFACGIASGASQHFRWLAEATSQVAIAQLHEEDRDFLAALPRWAVIDSLGPRILLVHATPKDPLYQYLGPDRDAWSRQVRGLDADILFVGHTHLQFQLELDDKVVVNPGSVGQPKDGDPRAAFAIIEDGKVLLQRASYDVEATISALEGAPVPKAAVRALSAVLRTGSVPDGVGLTSSGADAGERNEGSSVVTTTAT